MALKEDLTAIVGEGNTSDEPHDRYIAGGDASIHQGMPAIVVRAGTTEEVSEIMKLANSRKIPVVPRGAGSGMCGHAVPVDPRSIVIDLKRMNRIIDIRPQDLLTRVEAGVVNNRLNEALKPYGFFFAPCPASGKVATIGGMIANNASGLRAAKYGATRDSLLGAKVVLADGSIIDSGANTLIASAGYQIDRLMVASEGTLGIVTEAVLRLTPLPKAKGMGIAEFTNLKDAGNAISAIVASGVNPSFFELMDNVAIRSINKATDMGLPDVAAILVFECDGASKNIVDEEVNVIRNIVAKHNAKNLRLATDTKEMDALNAARAKLFPAFSRLIDGMACVSLADDMAVPPSFYAEVVGKIEKASKSNDVVITAYGHAGEGLIHTKLLIDTTSHGAWERAHKAVDEVYDAVLAAGGTVSGEHGVALSKAPYFKKEKGNALEAMRAIKKALDPNNILNPGKLHDAPEDWLTATNLRYPVQGGQS